MRKICIIPARLAASRFPNKPLVNILGLSMLGHICKRAAMCKELDDVVVATCDKEIKDHVESLGFKAVMTADTHERCTDRVEEAVAKLDFPLGDDDIVIMVQGDEVLVRPEMIEELIRSISKDGYPIVNLVCAITDLKYFTDSNAIKIVSNLKKEALYLSRSPIPSNAKYLAQNIWQQTGIIGFKKSFLDKFGKLDSTPLEKVESIDMLRVLEHGYPLALVETEHQLIGVDNVDDLKDVEVILKNDPLTKEYM